MNDYDIRETYGLSQRLRQLQLRTKEQDRIIRIIKGIRSSLSNYNLEMVAF